MKTTGLIAAAALVLPALLAAALLSSCQSAGPAGGSAAQGPAFTGGTAGPHGTALSGRSLYYGRCTACHHADPPHYYTFTEWRSMVAHMRKRAKLTPAEEANLLEFLSANAAAG